MDDFITVNVTTIPIHHHAYEGVDDTSRIKCSRCGDETTVEALSSKRVLAAIAKGKELTAATGCYIWRFSGNWQRRTLTAGEVVLAETLAFIQYGDSDYFGSDGVEVLDAFCTKIEELS